MRKLNRDLPALVLDAGLRCFGPSENLPDIAAVAVSGGSDSTALLRLAHWYWGQAGKQIVALTVDHGLRPESERETKQVATWCADLRVRHYVMRWHFNGTGNLSAAAREGRYHLMADFCKSHAIEHLYTGHTLDDQAETVLMRFARGSGVDGLTGMTRETSNWGISVIRPFIRGETRESLRAILAEFEQTWIEDPTNDDASYDRVKARQLLTHLEPLGVTVDSLSRLAHRMAGAKRVLNNEADKLIKSVLEMSPLGFATLDVDALASAEMDTACRVVSRAMSMMTARKYRAHLSFEEQIVALARRREMTGGQTLGGCMFQPFGDRFNILREPARCEVKTPTGQATGMWDERFQFQIDGGGSFSDLCVGALGRAGLRQIPKNYNGFSEAWHSSPYEAKLTTPGLWSNDVLLSAPLAPWTSDRSAPKLLISMAWSKMD